jgi:type IV pilus assembly protein PilW
MTRIVSQHPAYPGARAERGFSMVELLVALGLSMVIVVATTYVYLGTRETQRALFEKAYASETAHYALDVIGRDIENAGFYPSSAVVGVVQTYSNPVPVTASPPAAYNAKVFGCQANKYDPAASTPACAAHSSGVDADTLMVNSYTNDVSGLDIGNRADCLRQDSANDSVNATRLAATPMQPLFVSSRYTLVATAAQVEGQAISTFSLACNGNGKAVTDSVYEPIVAGVDQLRFYYLVRAGDSTSNSQFVRANAVTLANNWANVVAVRVCLMTRSMQSARLQGSTSYTIADCDGTSRSFTDGLERRVSSQTFALKNHTQILNF